MTKTLLSPLSLTQIHKYVDRSCLVDVLLEDSRGDRDVQTFDPSLLPSHCCDDFLLHMFQWAKDVHLLPLSTYGVWRGKTEAAVGVDVLPLFYAWLDCHEDESFQATGLM